MTSPASRARRRDGSSSRSGAISLKRHQADIIGTMVRKASPAGREKRQSSSQPPDEIQESLVESFPASDPPAWTVSRVGTPSRRRTRPEPAAKPKEGHKAERRKD